MRAFHIAGCADGLGTPPARGVERSVVSDPQQPGTERTVAAKAFEPVIGPQEGVLDDVVGLVGPNHTCRHPEHHFTVSLDERAERRLVTRPGPVDQLTVGVCGALHGSNPGRR